MNENVNLKPKKLSVAVHRAGTTGFEVDTSNDTDLFSGENYNWNDLLTLKDELGNGVLEFVRQVTSLVQNQDIISNLKDKSTHFYQTVELFFKDITDFSEKVKQNRILHEHKSGPVSDMDDFNLYNRVTMNYHSLCNELTILVTPTVSELMITVSEIVNESLQGEPQVIVPGESNE